MTDFSHYEYAGVGFGASMFGLVVLHIQVRAAHSITFISQVTSTMFRCYFLDDDCASARRALGNTIRMLSPNTQLGLLLTFVQQTILTEKGGDGSISAYSLQAHPGLANSNGQDMYLVSNSLEPRFPISCYLFRTELHKHHWNVFRRYL